MGEGEPHGVKSAPIRSTARESSVIGYLPNFGDALMTDGITRAVNGLKE